MDNVAIPGVVDENGNPIYKLIYHDSKLSVNAPWTDNQFSEIINVFETQPSKPFIEFEVRNGPEYFPIGSKIKNGSKVRIYRQDIYKSYSNGDGKAIVKTIQIFE